MLLKVKRQEPILEKAIGNDLGNVCQVINGFLSDPDFFIVSQGEYLQAHKLLA